LTLPEAPFDEPWQAQAFALTVHLHQTGAFTWSEWAAALSGQIAAQPEAPYYDAWLAALEQLTAAKRLAAPADLTSRKSAWEQAYLHTPHGKPVVLLPPEETGP
jgi:nitrile hydratase accessory protein